MVASGSVIASFDVTSFGLRLQTHLHRCVCVCPSSSPPLFTNPVVKLDGGSLGGADRGCFLISWDERTGPGCNYCCAFCSDIIHYVRIQTASSGSNGCQHGPCCGLTSPLLQLPLGSKPFSNICIWSLVRSFPPCLGLIRFMSLHLDQPCPVCPAGSSLPQYSTTGPFSPLIYKNISVPVYSALKGVSDVRCWSCVSDAGAACSAISCVGVLFQKATQISSVPLPDDESGSEDDSSSLASLRASIVSPDKKGSVPGSPRAVKRGKGIQGNLNMSRIRSLDSDHCRAIAACCFQPPVWSSSLFSRCVHVLHQLRERLCHSS